MSTTNERIAAAKKQVEKLKAEMAAAQQAKMDGYPGISKLNKAPTALGPLPKQRRILKGHFGKVYACHWAGNSEHLVSASQDGKLIVWNAKDNLKTQAIPLRSSWVMTCAFEQKSNGMVACGGLDNICSVYQIGKLDGTTPAPTRAHRELAAHDGYLSCCRFVNETSILTSSGDSTCLYWDIEMGQTKTTFTDHEGDVMSISMLPTVDANVFVSGSCDTLAKVWDIRTGKCTMTLRGHESDINSVCMFPDGKALGTGSDDSSCRFFDMRCIGEVSEFRNDMVLCGITSVSFSRSGRILFAGYDDYNCLGWDTMGATDKHHYQLQGHENRVSCVSVAPSGEALCTGSWDTFLKVWA